MKISAKMLADVYSALGKLPDETKIKITDTAIVFEKESEFKKGDIVSIGDGNGVIGVYKEKRGFSQENLYLFIFINKNEIKINDYLWGNIKTRLATDFEKSLFFEKMHESGYDFDFEKMEVVPWRWRAKNGEIYYLSTTESVLCATENGADYCSNKESALWFSGNYFQTKEQAEAYRQKRLKEIGGEK